MREITGGILFIFILAMLLCRYNKAPRALFLLLFFTSAVLTGCGTGDRNARAERLLQDRYGEEFVVLDSHQRHSGWCDFKMYPADTPDVIFEAWIDNGDARFSDNYVNRLMCKKVLERFSKGFDDFEKEYFLAVELWELAEPAMFYNAEVSLEDYSKEVQDPGFKIGILVSEDADPSDIYDCIVNGLSKINCTFGHVNVYLMTSDNLEKAASLLQKHNSMQNAGFKHISFESVCVEGLGFQDGRLELDENDFLGLVRKQALMQK